MKPLDRIFLLITGLLASYQVVQGIDGFNNMAIACYTIAFGVIVVASLLMIILGFDVLDSSLVAITTTLIPTSLALGLVSQFMRVILVPYGLIIVFGCIVLVIARVIGPGKLAVFVLAIVHGISGVTIFLLPLLAFLWNDTGAGFLLVAIGGMMMGLSGLLLSFLKTGNPIYSRETILRIFPGMLMLTTLAFTIGFVFM